MSGQMSGAYVCNSWISSSVQGMGNLSTRSYLGVAFCAHCDCKQIVLQSVVAVLVESSVHVRCPVQASLSVWHCTRKYVLLSSRISLMTMAANGFDEMTEIKNVALSHKYAEPINVDFKIELGGEAALIGTV